MYCRCDFVSCSSIAGIGLPSCDVGMSDNAPENHALVLNNGYAVVFYGMQLLGFPIQFV